jgi:membrane-bound lytic murein transglycosylase B
MLKNLILLKNFALLTILSSISFVHANDSEFNLWLNDFKIKAVNSGISEHVVEDVLSDVVFLPKVIGYDRYQPEFYEDTNSYINKRTSFNKINSSFVKKSLLLLSKLKVANDDTISILPK